MVNVYQQDPQRETTTPGKDGNDEKREGNGLEGQGPRSAVQEEPGGHGGTPQEASETREPMALPYKVFTENSMHGIQNMRIRC